MDFIFSLQSNVEGIKGYNFREVRERRYRETEKRQPGPEKSEPDCRFDDHEDGQVRGIEDVEEPLVEGPVPFGSLPAAVILNDKAR